MGKIIPFRNRTEQRGYQEISSESFHEEKCLSQGFVLKENYTESEKELLALINKYVISDPCSEYSFESIISSLKHNNKKMETDFEDLEELIIFSPEVQQNDFKQESSNQESVPPSKWGDVFLKRGSEYIFIFTLYTSSYVKEQFDRYRERIKPSCKDIILNSNHLSPPEIIRAAIKWVHLYFPALMGKPIFIEDSSVLQDLVCEPGVEVVLAKSSN